MTDHHLPPRPATPQPLLHRLPDQPSPLDTPSHRPSKFIVLLAASATVSGKLQIAQAVALALRCPLYQGDSLHETAARAARVGLAVHLTSNTGDADDAAAGDEAFLVNEARYRRMWLSKLTRTGLLFPEESRAAGSGFVGFGGGTVSSSGSNSRRGSESSVQSEDDDGNSSVRSEGSSVVGPQTKTVRMEYVNRPPLSFLREKEGEKNLALMVLTHPDLERWQKRCIRETVGEYGIGVIFVPLDGAFEPPVLQVLDSRAVAGFTSFDELTAAARGAAGRDWSKDVVLTVETDATVEEMIEEIIEGVRDIIEE